MKQTLLKQLIKLEKLLTMEGYEFDPKLRSSHNSLLMVIKLKKGDEAQILDSWDCVRRIE